MKIEYMLSIDDWVSFSLYYLETSTEGQRARSSGRITGSLLFITIGSILAFFTSSVVPLLLSLLAIGGWYFMLPQVLRSSQRTTTE